MATHHVYEFVVDRGEYRGSGEVANDCHALTARNGGWEAARALQEVRCRRHPDGSLRVRITIAPQDFARGVGMESVACVIEACCPDMQSRAEQAITSGSTSRSHATRD